MNNWVVYIICCADGSLYTGITIDLGRRVEEHDSGLGCKYTRPAKKRPVTLVYREGGHTQSSALKREAAIKKMSKQEKLVLIDQYKKGVRDAHVQSRRT